MQKLFFIIIFVYIWIGYIFYCVLPFSYYDELVALFFLGLLFRKKYSKEVRLFLCVALFYIVYSLFYSVNQETKAVLLDAFQQSKPYIFFYTFYTYKIHLSEQEKSWIRRSVILGVLFSLGSFFYDPTLYSGLYTHPALYGITIFCLSVLYYYCSKGNKSNKVITFLLLSLGLFSLRSKYYGEFIVALFCLYYIHKRFKFNMNYIIMGSIIILTVYMVVLPKFSLYFSTEDSARLALYQNAPKVLMDYFPFGSGFASYGTYFSGEYYSPLYRQLGMNDVWGLSVGYRAFISDTFFPSLVQEGFLGIILFILFWIRRFYSVIHNRNTMHQRLGIMIISFFFIESVAGSVFVMVYNFIPLFILATICRESDQNLLYSKNEKLNVIHLPKQSD